MKKGSDVPFEYMRDFLYVLSHDFGAHFRHIVEFSRLLSRDEEGLLTAEQQQWLGFIQRGGEQSQHMLNGMLNLSRLINRERDLQALQMNELIDAVWSSLPSSEAAGLELKALSPTTEPVYADKQDMVFILTALLSNALQYQPNSADHQVQIRISVGMDANQMSLQVEDNGIGVKEADYDRILMPLKRLDTDSYPDGLGVGLSGVKLLSHLYEGCVILGASPLGGLSVKLKLTNNNNKIS